VRKLKETPGGAFQLRPMTTADLPRVMEIEQEAFRNPWSRDLLAAGAGPRLVDHPGGEEPGPGG
jgi:ribosomal protein S18 acetylase RimI-like enzyme